MLIHVIPREGLKVPDPAFVTTPPLRHLPPEGRTVEDDGYWQRRVRDGVYKISGHEKIDYIDIIRSIKAVTGARAAVVKIPYGAFHALLWLYARFDKNPPFTVDQLKALVIPEVFPVIDWPSIFGVKETPLRAAFEETYLDPRYGGLALDF